MKLLDPEQIRQVDRATIENEPIAAVDLMERAALACFRRLIQLIGASEDILVFCGTGNNGGDGLAIARLLIEHGFNCHAVLLHFSDRLSPETANHYERLKSAYPSRLSDIRSADALATQLPSGTVAIDALLGTGANKPSSGLLAEAINSINTLFKRIISIDMPSGLWANQSSANLHPIVRAQLVLSFQLPKLAFLLPENGRYVPEFELLNIHLDQKALAAQVSNYHYITKNEVATLLKPRSKFSHKGTYGHALLMAGSKGKSGAALLAAEAALRSGAGLLTVHACRDTLDALLVRLPEAMHHEDPEPAHLSAFERFSHFEAIGFGPGVGTHADTQLLLKKLLHYYSGKLVIDADGLNILAENPTWLEFLPPDTLLTPHPKEFERLAGKQSNDFERLATLQQFAMKRGCIVILKGAHSAVAMPDGHVFFNSSGNAAMAKGGSGDALTGILTGLLARGYTAPQAALIGTFVHGYAGDLCCKKTSQESLLPSELIAALPKAFWKLEHTLKKNED